jgi:hypothetical protein
MLLLWILIAMWLHIGGRNSNDNRGQCYGLFVVPDLPHQLVVRPPPAALAGRLSIALQRPVDRPSPRSTIAIGPSRQLVERHSGTARGNEASPDLTTNTANASGHDYKPNCRHASSEGAAARICWRVCCRGADSAPVLFPEWRGRVLQLLQCCPYKGDNNWRKLGGSTCAPLCAGLRHSQIRDWRKLGIRLQFSVFLSLRSSFQGLQTRVLSDTWGPVFQPLSARRFRSIF